MDATVLLLLLFHPQTLKKFHLANPVQKSEIFDPLRKSRQRGVYIKWNGPQLAATPELNVSRGAVKTFQFF